MKIQFIIGIVVVSFVTACQSGNEAPPKNDKKDTVAAITDSDVVTLSAEQIKNANIAIGAPEQKMMHSTLKVSGTLDVPPQNIVSISLPLGGYVKTMALIPGQRVGQGEVLATVEDQQYIQLQQDYLTSKNKLEYAGADYARQKTLNETKAASDKILQQAQSELNNQKILVRSLGEKLRLIGINPETLTDNNISRTVSIRAPFSGYVTKVNVNIGKYVNPADVLLELIKRDDLHLSLTVFENDASRLSLGQKLTCYTNSRPDVKYTATIHLITPQINDDRSTEVHCDLDRPGKELFPGTFMNALIELGNAKVTAVPEEAIVKWENKYYLFSQEAGNTFRMLPVETGTTNGGFTEVKNTLSVDKVVIKNAYTLLMKMKNSAEEE
ncbi:MAG: efflux RND transporter periplasmic adaptor subunit [Chitinophagaceae bacterium]